jgi:hypothetical protein
MAEFFQEKGSLPEAAKANKQKKKASLEEVSSRFTKDRYGHAHRIVPFYQELKPGLIVGKDGILCCASCP